MVRISEDVRAKASRYIAEGRVMQDAVDDAVWWVEGTQMGRPYRVQVDVDGDGEVLMRQCTCRHGRAALGAAQCAHVVAVLAKVKEDRS